MCAGYRLGLGPAGWGLLAVALIAGCTGDSGGVTGTPMHPDGSGQVDLTNSPASDDSPAWRPR